jgi:hypothetical protein
MDRWRRSSGARGIWYAAAALFIVLLACGPSQPAAVTPGSIAPTAAGQSPDAIATGVAQALAQTQAAAPPGISLAGGSGRKSDAVRPSIVPA